LSFYEHRRNRRKAGCILGSRLQGQDPGSRARRPAALGHIPPYDGSVPGRDSLPMRLRLYHHPDGARVAYREVGAGPPLALLHSGLLSHREWEPVAERLAERHRLVIPDLPLHGDSEDRPRHPYTIDWFAEVMGGFADDVLGPNPLLVGHEAGAEILLQAIRAGRLRPSRLVLMPNRLHLPLQHKHRHKREAWRLATLGGSLPGLDRLLSHATKLVFTPDLGLRMSERRAPEAGDLMRHAFADVPGNPNLARSWAKCARRWPRGAQTQLLDLYPELDMPVLLLWADHDPLHPLAGAEETLRLLPRGQLRVLASTGFLMTYDDPVGVARELVAFCG
jgi:pimeloyl-ACP methyl ester carboxylesterase